jgi:23S rRNA (cytosine1962-C5)-methyltransferase
MSRAVRITRRAAERLRAGHLWVYRTDLAEVSEAADTVAAPGSLVTVQDPAGKPLGSALYSSASQIALRLVSRNPELSRAQYLEELRERIGAALERRRRVAPLGTAPGEATTAQRLLFSEADDVPGIVADRYSALVIVQLLIQGVAQPDVRAVVAEALAGGLGDIAGGLALWERPDPRIRELEQLEPAPESPLLFTGPGAEAPAATTFYLNGLQFGYDIRAGQKTGAFLDQRLNYRAAAEWVARSGQTRHALDICTYQGGFALHLAGICERVTGVDQSRAALETAEANLQRNPGLRAEVDWIEADAFAFLRALDSSDTAAAEMGLPRRFDAIVLDPPAFAKSRRAVEGALRGYKELNLRAMRLLLPGGTLVTCSCSHHVSLEAFWAVVAEAAADAGRRVQVLETRAAAPDHPEVMTLPETRYLKCLICRVD